MDIVKKPPPMIAAAQSAMPFTTDQQKAEESRRLIAAKDRTEIYRNTFNTNNGLRTLKDLMIRHSYFRHSTDPNTAIYREGVRAVIDDILLTIHGDPLQTITQEVLQNGTGTDQPKQPDRPIRSVKPGLGEDIW